MNEKEIIMKKLYQTEFKSTLRNPNVNGDGRLLTVLELDDGRVRIIITGLEGIGFNSRPLAISDVIIEREVWEKHKEIVIESAKMSNGGGK